jgi:putative endonuclease
LRLRRGYARSRDGGGCHGVVRRRRTKPGFIVIQFLTMYFVYSLESENCIHWYVGITNDVERRLAEHNDGRSMHTNKHKPWKLKSFTAKLQKSKGSKVD